MQSDLLWLIMMDRHSSQVSATAFLHLFPYKMHWKNCYFCSPQRSAKRHISRKCSYCQLTLFTFQIYASCYGWMAPCFPPAPLSLVTETTDCSLPSWQNLLWKVKERWKRQWGCSASQEPHTSPQQSYAMDHPGWKSSKTHSDFWWVCRFCFSSYIPHLYILMTHSDNRRQDTELLFPLDRYPEISLGLKDWTTDWYFTWCFKAPLCISF